MGKRKLRNCSNCGERHGPPTGKNCGRVSLENREESAGVTGGLPERSDAILVGSTEGPIGAEGGQVTAPMGFEDVLEFTNAESAAALEEDDYSDFARRPSSPAGSGPSGARFLRQQLQLMQDERRAFEEKVDGRMAHMENTLGKVAGVQQAQLERLSRMYLADHPGKKPSKEPSQSDATPPAPQEAAAQPSKVSAGGAGLFDFKDLSNLTVPEGEEQWKNYHGFAAWHLENEKSKKNPFDHQAFVKKGEKVVTFEDLMIVTFKTVGKIVEMKGDVRGIVSHGKMMAEKA